MIPKWTDGVDMRALHLHGQLANDVLQLGQGGQAVVAGPNFFQFGPFFTKFTFGHPGGIN